jgi:peptide deformylase
MAIRDILVYPDPRLREVGKPVEKFDDDLQKLVEDMAETMYAAPGVGLAATQIGVALRVFVIDIASEDEPSDLKVFINPEIVGLDGAQTYREGCLSFPGVAEDIKRAAHVRVRAVDAKGIPFELEADGLLAVAIQHENDHLNGELMIDRVGPVKRRMMSRKMQRQAAQP